MRPGEQDLRRARFGSEDETSADERRQTLRARQLWREAERPSAWTWRDTLAAVAILAALAALWWLPWWRR